MRGIIAFIGNIKSAKGMYAKMKGEGMRCCKERAGCVKDRPPASWGRFLLELIRPNGLNDILLYEVKLWDLKQENEIRE
ncbi:MAG: hypothetical protein HRT90_06290 [Candidatus Margulisbacteria bacterium]|nr:hypothetical protein [Candidatus Margulisiibacteriota bacterium]